jgi:hypothetical protein
VNCPKYCCQKTQENALTSNTTQVYPGFTNLGAKEDVDKQNKTSLTRILLLFFILQGFKNRSKVHVVVFLTFYGTKSENGYGTERVNRSCTS